MRHLWDFFEKANALVYVSDMDSHEIVYMNRKALEIYHLSSVDDVKEKKCHEVLFGNCAPCAVCSNAKLEEGEFLEWEYFNPMLNRHFHLMDTMTIENGRRCRFEIAIDINENEDSRRSSGRHADLEARVNKGIQHAICEPDPNKSIDIILEFLGKILNGDRACVFEKNALGGDDNTYEWTAAGATPQKHNLQNLPPEICEQWYRSFKENKKIMFDDIEEMKDTDPLQYETLKKQDIHSVVAVPLYDNFKIIGFYGIDNPPRQELDYAINMLQIVGYFITSMIKRRDIMNQLCEMSFLDQLTKLGNRYAMGEYIVNVRKNKSLGVVYCDISGLKRVNDTLGHEMGDDLICRAAQSLKSAFEGYGLFRIGGDELLVICENIDEDTLHSCIELLRQKAMDNSVNLAIGAVWEQNYKNNMQKCISEAEERMYKDKNEYYRLAGIDRRR